MDESTVLVPVPTWLLGEVYELLGRRMSEGPNFASEDAPRSPAVVREAAMQYRLPEDMFSQRRFASSELGLLKRTLEPQSLARTLMDTCARTPGEPVSFDDIVKEAGLKSEQARGQIGSFTKILKKLFRTPEWPVAVHYGTQGQATYIMSEATARTWREL